VTTRFELTPVPTALAERYLAEGAWDDRSLGQFLRDALLEDPSRRFRIWSPVNPYLGTVGEVYEESLRLAGGLRALGLGPGDVVAFQLPNWVEAAVTFYACAMLGVTLVPIVHFYGPKEVGFILRQSGARMLVIVSRIGQRDYLSELAAVRDGLPDLEHVVIVGDSAGGVADDLRFDDVRGPSRARPPSTPTVRPSSGTPRARRPIRRESCTPTARSGARSASSLGTRPIGTARPSWARRWATPSGCSVACSVRWWAGSRST